MMAISFPEQTAVLGKPDQMSDLDCAQLPVFIGKDASGLPIFISKWQLNKEDIEDILDKGFIYLCVVGSFMPPVILQTEYPFVSPDQNSNQP